MSLSFLILAGLILIGIIAHAFYVLGKSSNLTEFEDEK